MSDNELLLTPTDNHLELSDVEKMFVYQLEVIGLPAKRAAEVAGLSAPYVVLKKPHIVAAREQARLSLRGRVNFTREDVIAGYHKAIEQAVVMADPLAQIAGWREISKILGYDKTNAVHIHLSGTADNMRKQVAALTNADLMAQLGDDNVLDADFYRMDEAPDGAA